MIWFEYVFVINNDGFGLGMVDIGVDIVKLCSWEIKRRGC